MRHDRHNESATPMNRRDFVTTVSTLAVAGGVCHSNVAWGQEATSQDSPSDVARASFEALRKRDLDAYVSYIHPDALKKYKAFAVAVFNYENPDEEVKQIRTIFYPYHTADAVEAASGAELNKAALKNTLAGIPDLDTLLADAKLQVLGEIAESPDTVHVITRTFLPRPSPTTYKKRNGRWFQLLNDEQLRLVAAFEQKAHFRAKGLKPEQLPQKVKLDKVDVIGHVPDGDGVAQVLCRGETSIEDFKIPFFACYPVRKGEPAWNWLKADDEAELIKVLRAKWEQ
jgi:hypothetical protein